MTESVTVQVVQGTLRGQKETSKCEKEFYSFRGIPYAKPPVGPLRFKAPQPPDNWEGIRDALVEGPVCPHIQNYIDEGYKGDEDCLFLNVFTPELPTTNKEEKLKAVMVYIHGGGFNSGSGNSEFYGPDFLLNEDVVVVTLNYRLGVLGFLSTGNSEVPGNNGLKDQVMALRWVQKNIAQFGGDPNRVTIFGESAGGACVHYHMLSPMSKGLFAQAISQSGSALNPWAFNNAIIARSKTFRYGKALGFKTLDSIQLIKSLSTVPVQKLVENVSKAMTEEERDLGTVFFRPTVEVEPRDDEEAFLTSEPIEIISRGEFHNVPFISGINSSEGLLCLKDVMAKPAVLKTYDADFEILVPGDLKVERGTTESKAIAQKIKEFYFGDKPVSQETLFQYVDLSSDCWFVLGILNAVKMHASQSSAPVYCYQFSFDGQLGFFKRLVGAYRFPGVCHADELGSLFFSPHLDLELDDDCPEVKMRSQLVQMWTRFAKSGNPSPSTLNCDPVTSSNLYYLNIDSVLTIQQQPMKKRMEFWEELSKSVNQ